MGRTVFRSKTSLLKAASAILQITASQGKAGLMAEALHLSPQKSTLRMLGLGRASRTASHPSTTGSAYQPWTSSTTASLESPSSETRHNRSATTRHSTRKHKK